ncbi:MAG: hypothetical protein Q9M43_12445 [Sulfurimonas sp.]|nr:hypothetical protein [Sulfurimonas sp.]
MTEDILLQKVKEWCKTYSLQLDKLSMDSETKLANGQVTYAANQTSYACLSKDEKGYKTLVFSYRSLIVFAFENSIITADEAIALEPAFIVPPERKDAKLAADMVLNLKPKIPKQ